MYSRIGLGNKHNNCEYETLLDALKSCRVFSIRKNNDMFEIWDGDDYYHISLTRENYEKLIKEMMELL